MVDLENESIVHPPVYGRMLSGSMKKEKGELSFIETKPELSMRTSHTEREETIMISWLYECEQATLGGPGPSTPDPY